MSVRDFVASTRAARVGDMTGAGNFMRQAIAGVDWRTREPVHRGSGWTVYTHEAMSEYAYFVDLAQGRIVMDRNLWPILACHQPAVDHLLETSTRGASGLKYVTMDAGPYREAALMASRAAGTDVVRATDALTDVEERIARFTVTVIGLQDSIVTDLQRRIVVEDFTRLNEDLRAFESRLSDARARLDVVNELLGCLA